MRRLAWLADWRCRRDSHDGRAAVVGRPRRRRTRTAPHRLLPPTPGNVSLDKNCIPGLPERRRRRRSCRCPPSKAARGLQGDGWETSTDFDLIGDPRAVKGGELRQLEPDGLSVDAPVLRAEHHGVEQGLHGLVYETLAGAAPDVAPVHSRPRDALANVGRPPDVPVPHQSEREILRRHTRHRRQMSSRRGNWWTDKSLQDPAQTLVYSQLRSAGCREQIHRVGEGQGRELAEPDELRRQPAPASRART